MTDVMRGNRDSSLTSQKMRSSHSRSKTEARNDSDLKSKTKRRDSTSPDEGIANSPVEIESSPTSSRQKLERTQGQLIQIDIKGGICKESRSKHSRRKPRGSKTAANDDKMKSEEVHKTQKRELPAHNGSTKSHKNNTSSSTAIKANKPGNNRVHIVKEPLTKITTSNNKATTNKHMKSGHKNTKSNINPDRQADKSFEYTVVDKTKAKQVTNERKGKKIDRDVYHRRDQQHKTKSKHNKKIKDAYSSDRRAVDKEAPRTLRHRGLPQDVSQRCKIDKKFNLQDALSRSRKKTADNSDTRNVSDDSSCSELSNYSSESESYFSDNSQSTRSSYTSTETVSSTSSLSSTVLLTSSASSESDSPAMVLRKSTPHRRSTNTHHHEEQQLQRHRNSRLKSRERTEHVYQHNNKRARTPVGRYQNHKGVTTKPLQRRHSSHGKRHTNAKSAGKVQKHTQEEKTEAKKGSVGNTDDHEFEINLEQRRKKLKNLRIHSEEGQNKDLKKTHWQHQKLVLTSQIPTPVDSRPKEKVKKSDGTTRQKSFEASATDSNGAILTIRDLYSLHHVLSDTQNGTVIS